MNREWVSASPWFFVAMMVLIILAITSKSGDVDYACDYWAGKAYKYEVAEVYNPNSSYSYSSLCKVDASGILRVDLVGYALTPEFTVTYGTLRKGVNK